MTGIVRYKSYDLLTSNFGNAGGLDSHTYKIEIYDLQGTGILSPFFDIIGEPILSYESQSDKIYSTIKGSSLEFDVKIDNDTDKTWFMNTFLQSTEERFIINLFRDGDLFWSGYPLYDLGELQDASYPFAFKIKATDGLARLKNFEFTYATANDNFQSLTEYIGNILQKTPLYDYLNDIASISNLFSTCVNWYEYNMATSYTDDPLNQSYLRRFVFATQDSNQSTALVGMTYYDVLDKILLAFNCRIILSDGYYKIVSISQYDSGSAMYERCYTFGAYTSPATTNTVTNTWKSVIAQDNTGGYVEAGNKWGFYPAAKTVITNLNYPLESQQLITGNINKSPCTPSSATWNAQTPINTLTSDGTERLHIKIPFTFEIPSSTQSQISAVSFEIELKIGAYYLTNQWNGSNFINSAVKWAGGGTAILGVQATSRGASPRGTVPITWSYSGIFEIETDVIPAGVYPSSGNHISIIPNVITRYNNTTAVVGTYNYCYANLYQIYMTFGNARPQTSIQYIAANGTPYINSEAITHDLIFGETYIGSNKADGYNQYIYTKKIGSVYTPSTGSWKIGGSGTGMPLNQLLSQEICALLILPMKRYQGSIISNIEPHWKMSYGGEYYILNGGNYSIISQTWQGEWIQVHNIRSSVTNQSSSDNSNNSQVFDIEHSFNGLSANDTDNFQAASRLNNERSIGIITSDLTGTITSIPVDSLKNTIYSGDIIKIFPLGITAPITAAASSGASIGATSITISSLALTSDILNGSFVSLGTYTATGLNVTSGKRLSVSNTMTLTATDGSTINFAGGGSVAYQDQVNAFTKNNDFFGTTQYTALRARGTVSGAAGGGLYLGSYNSQYGGIWSDQVTASTFNYMAMSKGNSTYFNSTSNFYFAINDSPKGSMNGTGLLIGGDPSSYNAAAKVDIVGALNGTALSVNVHNDHTGTYKVFEILEASSVAKIGFFGVSAVARQTQGATLTNNITSGGSANTLADWDIHASFDSTLSTTIRNDMYQMGQTLKTVVDALRNYGLLT